MTLTGNDDPHQWEYPQGHGPEDIEEPLKIASAKVRNRPVDRIQIGRHP
jgi:hypothetical protein